MAERIEFPLEGNIGLGVLAGIAVLGSKVKSRRVSIEVIGSMQNVSFGFKLG